MKIKYIVLILLFSRSIYGQVNTELIRKLGKINLQVKLVDSLANYTEEQVLLGVIKISHGRIDGKPIRELYTNTRITKYSNQVVRICYRERPPDYDEDLNLYFFESKLIYAERIIWKGMKHKFYTERFFYENEIEISNQNLTEGINVIVKAENLIKQGNR